VNRTADLYVRRRVLIERCELQRADLASRMAELSASPLRRVLSGGAAALVGAARGGRHPLAWVATVVGLVLLRRPRQAVTLLAWTRTALTVLTRVTQVLAVMAALRRRR